MVFVKCLSYPNTLIIPGLMPCEEYEFIDIEPAAKTRINLDKIVYYYKIKDRVIIYFIKNKNTSFSVMTDKSILKHLERL